MSSSETVRHTLGRAGRGLALAGALGILAGCTAGPLYGTSAVDPVTGTRSSFLSDLRGRIAVTPAQTRTAQVFRNAMLYKLNGAEPVRDPLYELRYTISATDQVSALETGTGVPTASLYRMSVNYTLIRLSDGKPLTEGTRFAMVPYDRTGQLFAAERAVIDAREQAGPAVAERVLAVIAPVLQREGFAPAAAVVGKG